MSLKRSRGPPTGSRGIGSVPLEERLEALGALFARLGRRDSVEAVTAEVSAIVDRFAPCDALVLALRADDAGAVRLLRADPPRRSVSASLERASGTPFDQVFTTGMLRFATDLDLGRLPWDVEARRGGLRSYVVLPLVSRGAPEAAMLLASRERSAYDAACLPALAPLISTVGYAVESAATSVRDVRRARRLKLASSLRTRIGRARSFGEMADALADLLPDIAPFDRLSIALLDREVFRLVAVRGRTGREFGPAEFERPRHGSLLGAAIDLGRPLVVADQAVAARADDVQMRELGLHSFLIAPLYADDEPIGTLNLGSAKPGEYGSAEAEALDPIAEQVAAAVTHLRVLDEVRGLADVVVGVSDAVVMTDDDLRVTFANEACLRTLGRRRDALVGVSLDDLLGSPLPRAARDAARAGGWHGEVLALDGSGRQRLLALSVSVLRGREGRAAGFVAIGHDVSEERKLQRQSAQAEQLAALGTLAAGVGHEIRNPAGWLLANLEVLASNARGERSLAPAERIEAIDDCLDGVRRIRDIAADLRGFAGPESEAPGLVDLQAVAHRAARMTGAEVRRRATLQLDLGPVPPVLGREGRLAQVVVNLLVNAAQAIPEGEAQHVIRISTRAEGDRVVVDVEDDGVGIPPDIAERIFEPFFTTKAKSGGTGLGLSVCLDIVRDHGGTLSASPRPPGGTRMRMALPALGCAGDAAAPALRAGGG